MKLFSEKTGNHLFYILIVIEIIFLILVWSSKHQDISFQNETLDTLNDNWVYTDADGLEHLTNLPSRLSVGKDKPVIISRILPDQIPASTTMATLSSHQSMHAYINNQLFYSCGGEENSFIDLTPGTMWNVIKLPEDSAGKTITLEIMPDHGSSNVINEIFFGTKSAFLIHLIQTRTLSLLISIMIFFIGLTLVIIYLLLYQFLKKNKSILYLGMFSILVSLWMIMESDMTQFLMGNRYLISSLKYISLMTLPIPMLFYVSLIDNVRFKKLAFYFNFLFIGNAFIMMILQALNIVNFHDGLLLLQILLVVIFSTVFYKLLKETVKYKNKSTQYLSASFGFLFIFSMIEIISYNTNIEMNSGTFLQLGVLFFMIIVSFRSLQRAVEIIRLSKDAKHFEYLASRDYMTKCKNRAAYSEELDHLPLDREIAIVMADINNMKYINDTFGHHAGDAVIIRCSQCLIKTLGNDEQCYRIGGDEFVCIEFDQSKDIVENRAVAFINECKTLTPLCPYHFEVSTGYAFYDKGIDKDIYDTIKRADKNMYQRKLGMKV